MGFVVGQSGAGAGFLRVLRFPLQSSFAQPITPQSPSYIIRGKCTIGQCGRSAGAYRDLGDLKQRDLRNQNLGDLKRDLRGFKSHPTKKSIVGGEMRSPEHTVQRQNERKGTKI
jgi:hypothetical protein